MTLHFNDTGKVTLKWSIKKRVATRKAIAMRPGVSYRTYFELRHALTKV